MSTIPFSYFLLHKPTGLKYYGIKYSTGSSPAILWVTYFTSSTKVKELIDQFGPDSFVVTVRRTFSTGEEALLWEHKVLRRLRAAERLDWLNRHNGGSKFRAPLHHSEKTKSRIKEKITGMRRTTETKHKLSKSAVHREQMRREHNWSMPKDAIARAISTRKERIALGEINPYSTDRNKKMGDTKRGCKRQYLPDGTFIMVRPQQDQ